MTLSELKSILNKAASEKRKADDLINELESMSDSSFEELVFSILEQNSDFKQGGKYAISVMREDGMQQPYYQITKIEKYNEFKYNRLGLSFGFTLNIKCFDATDKELFHGSIHCKYNFHQRKASIDYDTFYTYNRCTNLDYYEQIKGTIVSNIADCLKVNYYSKSRF